MVHLVSSNKARCYLCGVLMPDSELNGIDKTKIGDLRYQQAYCRILSECNSAIAKDLIQSQQDQNEIVSDLLRGHEVNVKRVDAFQNYINASTKYEGSYPIWKAQLEFREFLMLIDKPLNPNVLFDDLPTDIRLAHSIDNYLSKVTKAYYALLKALPAEFSEEFSLKDIEQILNELKH